MICDICRKELPEGETYIDFLQDRILCEHCMDQALREKSFRDELAKEY